MVMNLAQLQSVAVANGEIVDELKGAIEVDGREGYLLPGLTDAHIHFHDSKKSDIVMQMGSHDWPGHGVFPTCHAPVTSQSQRCYGHSKCWNSSL